MLPGEGYLGAHLDGGVQLRPFDYDKKCQFLLAHVDCSPEISAKVIEYARSQIGKPYDWTSLVGFMVHRDWRSPDSWFCSDLVAWCFESAGYSLLNDDKYYNRITPAMVRMSPYVVADEPPC